MKGYNNITRIVKSSNIKNNPAAPIFGAAKILSETFYVLSDARFFRMTMYTATEAAATAKQPIAMYRRMFPLGAGASGIS